MSVASASAQSLYSVGSEAQETTPLKWVVGTTVIYDDNVSPGIGPKQDSFGINPNVGLSVVNITPQTTWDVYARLGLVYYLDSNTPGMNDVNSQSRLGVNLTHRFSERLRFTSQNFAAYELEPDYSTGYASSRQSAAHFYWQTDNSLGFRWTERFGTYTGFSLTGATFPDVANNDRFTWELYNQCRYQFGPQTVLTLDTRYSQTTANDLASNANDTYLLLGAEQRFSPNTIGVVRAGTQCHDVNGGAQSTSPYVEFALSSQMTQQLSVRAFTRYGIENYANVLVPNQPGVGLVQFDDQRTMRLGISAQYAISPMFSLFGGVDYIPTSYSGGHTLTTPPFLGAIADQSEDLLCLTIGSSIKFNDLLTGTLSYSFTDSTSGVLGRTYERNRISLGLSAEF
jgi:hypothetical protein